MLILKTLSLEPMHGFGIPADGTFGMYRVPDTGLARRAARSGDYVTG
jgi:hypothetical protein